MQLISYLEIIKNIIALIIGILFIITLPVLLIKEHIKNIRHQEYEYDTQKEVRRKIEKEQQKLDKFLAKQLKKVKKVKER